MTEEERERELMEPSTCEGEEAQLGGNAQRIPKLQNHLGARRGGECQRGGGGLGGR